MRRDGGRREAELRGEERPGFNVTRQKVAQRGTIEEEEARLEAAEPRERTPLAELRLWCAHRVYQEEEGREGRMRGGERGRWKKRGEARRGEGSGC